MKPAVGKKKSVKQEQTASLVIISYICTYIYIISNLSGLGKGGEAKGHKVEWEAKGLTNNKRGGLL